MGEEQDQELVVGPKPEDSIAAPSGSLSACLGALPSIEYGLPRPNRNFLGKVPRGSLVSIPPKAHTEADRQAAHIVPPSNGDIQALSLI